MKSRLTQRYKQKGSHGGILAMVAILLIVFIGVAALAIDIGYLSTTRNELQNVADSAALAGAGFLGSVYVSDAYKDLTPAQRQTYTFYRSEVVDVVQDAGVKNKAAGVNIDINDTDTDIIIGKWDPGTLLVGPPGTPPGTLIVPDAVSVIARRDDQANSPISTSFAEIFNFDTLAVSAEATAALSGPSWVTEGELKTPFGLSENVFPNNCTDLIEFSPTTESCAAWHNFLDPINANNMADKLIGLIQGDDTGDGSCEYCDGNSLLNGPEWLEANFDISKTPDSEVTPATEAGEEFEFQGGTIASLFLGGYMVDAAHGGDYVGNTGTVFDNDKKPAPMLALFDYFRYRDNDGDNSVWSAIIPVYKDEVDPPGCMNANTSLEVVGYAKIVVIRPDPPPSNNLQVHVDCNVSMIEGRSGGSTYGNLLGTIPALVK